MRKEKQNKMKNEELYEKLLNSMQDATCKMIIAELESIREELNNFIDELIQEKIEKYKSED